MGIYCHRLPKVFGLKSALTRAKSHVLSAAESTGLPDLMFVSDNFLASWRMKVRNTLKRGSMAKPNFNIDFANLMLATTIVGLICLAISASHAEPMDNWVQDYVVQFLGGDEQNAGGAGVYLGNGLVISAAHVAGGTGRVCVRSDGQNKVLFRSAHQDQASFPEARTLSLISYGPGRQFRISAPCGERRMTLCQEQPPTGAPVILAAPQGITRTTIASPTLISPEYRTKFSTLTVSEASMWMQ